MAAVAQRRLILIPPSEGKELGGEGPPWAEARGDHPLASRRREVIAALGPALRNRAAAARLLGARGDTLERFVEADLAVDSAATLPAIQRYTGVLYQHLDAAALDRRSRTRLGRTVRIFSGLWGVVAPDEWIPDYRLKMSASLPGPGKLSTWWRGPVSDLLAAEAKGAEVWNLLPREHAAAWQAPPGVVECRATFLQPGPKGTLVAVSHWNKALKGSLVAHLVAHPTASIDDLCDWDHPAGYRLDPHSIEAVDGVRALRFVTTG